MTPSDQFNEFDEVVIINQANVRWLFTDRCSLVGMWTVVATVTNHIPNSDIGPDAGSSVELVLGRSEFLIRIPRSDVRKVSTYSIDAFLDHLKRTSGYGQVQEEITKTTGGGR